MAKRSNFAQSSSSSSDWRLACHSIMIVVAQPMTKTLTPPSSSESAQIFKGSQNVRLESRYLTTTALRICNRVPNLSQTSHESLDESLALVSRVGVSTVAHVRWVCIVMVLRSTRIQLPVTTAMAHLQEFPGKEAFIVRR